MCCLLFYHLFIIIIRDYNLFIIWNNCIIRFKDLLTKYPLPSHQEPHCAEVVPLPYSMVALDHLMGVAGREELPTGESVAETALKQVSDVHYMTYIDILFY